MKGKVIGYWVCTILVVFFMLPGGIFYLMRAPQAVEGMRQLGIPVSVVVLLGVWKVLGSIALVVPGFALLKEWAYAGTFFNYTGALASHFAARDGANVGLIVLAVVVVLSWALRPSARRLGPS